MFWLVAIGGLLSGTSLFVLPTHRKAQLALLMSSAAVSLYGLELYLTLRDPFGGLLVKDGVFDTRSRLEVITEFKDTGVEAYPLISSWMFVSDQRWSPSDLSVFPFSGLSDSMMVYCNETGRYTIFRSDEHGFNNPKGLYVPGAVDGVVIGDSAGLGACVQPREDVASQLRALTGLRILNLSQTGHGPLLELAMLREFGRVLKPRIVLWLYYEGNDLENVLEEEKVPVLKNYLSEDFIQDVFRRQDEINMSLKALLDKALRQEQAAVQARRQTESPIRKVVKFDALRSAVRKSKWGRPTIGQENTGDYIPLEADFRALALFNEVLEAARDETASWGGDFYFVYLPDWARFDHGYSLDSNWWNRPAVLRLVSGLSVSVVDFAATLEASRDPLGYFPFRRVGHYNASGYDLLAQTIERQLVGSGHPVFSSQTHR